MEVEKESGIEEQLDKVQVVKHKRPRKHIPAILRPGNYMLIHIQEAFNKVFTTQLNPLYFLGAITFLLFWVALGSGIYLFLLYEMGPSHAYNSVQAMTVDQAYYSGIVRSLHRYSSDGLVIVILIHMGQVFFSDRFRKYRWVAWVTGAFILPVLWMEGVTGYFLPWDQVAQMTAISLAEMLSHIPLSAEPAQRLFATNDSVTSLLFFITNYLHLAIPCLVLILAWIHCMRISMPLINPPREITITILAALFVLALIKPATSAGPADLGKLVGEVNIDWFYLGIFVLFDKVGLSGGQAVFWGIFGYFAFLSLPWIIMEARKKEDEDSVTAIQQTAPTVDLAKCKGCPLCQMACPFEAMIVVNRKDGRNFESQAELVGPNCAHCGFCVNACEFGAVSMGEWNKSSFHDFVTKAFEPDTTRNGDAVPTSIAFICERSFNLEGFLTEDCKRVDSTPEVAVMVIPCIGSISPSLVDHCFEVGAKGVMVIGCRGLDCHYRELRRRLHLVKEESSHKFLVEGIEDDRLMVMEVSPLQIEKIRQEIDEFNSKIKERVEA